MRDEDIKELAAALIRTAQSTGELIMRYRNSTAEVSFKEDGSPVTDADRAAEELILNDLARLAPGIVVVAEESASVIGDALDPQKSFFLVDPLDGTRDFVRGGKDFTVNIALIRQGEPVFGLIYAPAIESLYLTPAVGEAVSARLSPSRGEQEALQTTPLRTREPEPGKLTALTSRSHLNEATSRFMSGINVSETLQFSSSLKFGMLADGGADLYPRLSPTSEWDTAAGQAILHAAGGYVVSEAGTPLKYGKIGENFLNPGFIAWGRRNTALDLGAAKV
ncbi:MULTISPECIES: 3'(2'),5'-bisphosphate nucleotidase CysQ [Rhodomicrobium]|uniref:3'(2'),5'-bisphosphate nucleotidase CysQ n=1 Tax=Rhodomicrobium TaxID=1068 RepID=UPI000B4A6008|nr:MULTISPECIES: 3'(2'),5'-bisphosphate nucleotidase CysQ [Rhodomicrobium]